jgi:hypothetical protein
MSAAVSAAIASRFFTLSPTAHVEYRPSGVVKTMVRVSESTDSIQPRTVTLLANDTPRAARPASGPAPRRTSAPSASAAARMETPAADLSERIVIGSYL